MSLVPNKEDEAYERGYKDATNFYENLLQARKWQSMETAPKDGTWVLVVWGGHTHMAHWLDNTNTILPWAGWTPPPSLPWPSGVPMAWMHLPDPEIVP